MLLYLIILEGVGNWRFFWVEGGRYVFFILVFLGVVLDLRCGEVLSSFGFGELFLVIRKSFRSRAVFYCRSFLCGSSSSLKKL